jgi:hypothetical protein
MRLISSNCAAEGKLHFVKEFTAEVGLARPGERGMNARSVI